VALLLLIDYHARIFHFKTFFCLLTICIILRYDIFVGSWGRCHG